MIVILRCSRPQIVAAGLIAAAIFVNAAAAPQNRPSGATASRNKNAASASSVSFVDVTRAAGLDFHLTCGGTEKRYIMESMCGGVAVLDYDNDGWMDIFLVNGSTLEDLRTGKCHPGNERSPERNAKSGDQQGRDVGADTVEGGMAKVELPGIAENEVEPDGEDDVDGGNHQGRAPIGILKDEGQCGDGDDGDKKPRAARALGWHH